MTAALCLAPLPTLAQLPQRKSIHNWAKCDGRSDDAQAVATAFAAASHGVFTLVIDCPVRLHIGTDVARTVFIDTGTRVEFTSGGRFLIDNIFHPAFVIANSSSIELRGWDVVWDGNLPTNWDVGGYDRDGQHVSMSGYAQPAAAWHDQYLTPWLAQQRHLMFDKSMGNVGSLWWGATNSSSVFYIDGDSSQLEFSGMRLHVPDGAGPERYIPMAFSFSSDYRSNQTVNAKTPRTVQYVGIPHDVRFHDIDLDGTYMGWQGNVSNASFTRIRSHRYGDLQDAGGGNVGGIKKWFAPPHLFYLNYGTQGDPALFNRQIKISDVVDEGVRGGTARDKGGADTVSGYALSLKIGCVDCSVDGYTSMRPDGFLDLLRSERMTISNVKASFDSGFLNGVFPGWRFPDAPYKDVVIENVILTDTAATSLQPPIGSATSADNSGVQMRNIDIIMNHWSGPGQLMPTIAGDRSDVGIRYAVRGDDDRYLFAQHGRVGVTVKLPRVSAGDSVSVNWTSKGANRCSGSGPLAGELPPSGTRSVPARALDQLTLSCSDGNDTAVAGAHSSRQP